MLLKIKNKYEEKAIAKAKNNFPIRVIYKKLDSPPQVRIIDNVFKLKKAIIEKNLDIIPYEKKYIICNNKKFISNTKPNIFLTFRCIYGDIILVNIDRNNREFKSLSQEDIIWYSQDLINKSSSSTSFDSAKKYNTRNFPEFYERNFETNTNRNSFEKTLLNTLINIELVLANILKNNKNGDIKNE